MMLISVCYLKEQMSFVMLLVFKKTHYHAKISSNELNARNQAT